MGLQVAPEGGRAAHWRSRMRDLSTTTSARLRCNSASCGDGAAWHRARRRHAQLAHKISPRGWMVG